MATPNWESDYLASDPQYHASAASRAFSCRVGLGDLKAHLDTQRSIEVGEWQLFMPADVKKTLDAPALAVVR
ncbi:hypothetical protein RGR602_PC00025 (plasmid) [Rhizobium gallicum bv. gallicum R602sp]|uniref:Uncharacterized protein n=1 Tax=Rhizobium gallicum bv. gallicum R602sp TaxID=1041138 RepID=A0A0B4XC30_9HYPH|nr:hypothetical protein RGR602_PC00025 [Rhizobium gallicum bv. gallicum R602sp]